MKLVATLLLCLTGLSAAFTVVQPRSTATAARSTTTRFLFSGDEDSKPLTRENEPEDFFVT
jgi:hypothetical protein